MQLIAGIVSLRGSGQNPTWSRRSRQAALECHIWLQEIHPHVDGNSDLVTYFFRAAFQLLR